MILKIDILILTKGELLMHKGTHKDAVLSDLSQFSARICGCGVIHFSFGPTTINLTRDVFRGLVRMVSEMDRELRRPAQQVDDSTPVDAVPLAENVIRGLFGSIKQEI